MSNEEPLSQMNIVQLEVRGIMNAFGQQNSSLGTKHEQDAHI